MNEHIAPETILEQPVCWRLFPKLMDSMQWELVRPTLEKAESLSDGEYTAQSIIDQFHKGDIQLWIIWDKKRKKEEGDKPSISCPQHLATFLTRVDQIESGKKRLWIDFVNGRECATWTRVIVESMRIHARKIGCQSIEAVVRAGFVKPLEKAGCKKRKAVMTVEV